MLSDEERKIETLKKYINSQEQKMNDYYKIDEEFYKDEIEQLEFSIKLLRYILNLIKKQQKEIEELKEKNKTLKNLQNDTNRLYIEMIERKNYFERELQKVEDKIKAKIEDLKENSNGDDFNLTNVIMFFKSLLEKE